MSRDLPEYLRRELLVAAHEKPHIYRSMWPVGWLAIGWDYATDAPALHAYLVRLDRTAPCVLEVL